MKAKMFAEDAVVDAVYAGVGRGTVLPVGARTDEMMEIAKEIVGRMTEVHPSSLRTALIDPIPMRISCPECRVLHIDEGEFATKPHHTHSCQNCGLTWRPAVVHTVGVRFLPGFKNE